LVNVKNYKFALRGERLFDAPRSSSTPNNDDELNPLQVPHGSIIPKNSRLGFHVIGVKLRSI
jgi:hypothetical protein